MAGVNKFINKFFYTSHKAYFNLSHVKNYVDALFLVINDILTDL